MTNIKLGDSVKDKVTGLKGIVVAKVEYLNGCIQFCVKPKMKKNGTESPNGEYIDYQQLKILKKGNEKEKTRTGGPQRDCPKI